MQSFRSVVQSRSTVAALATLIVIALCSGCEQPLFVQNQPRTPYERYQILRGQYRPAMQQNVYGGDEPALRDRLRPLDRR